MYPLHGNLSSKTGTDGPAFPPHSMWLPREGLTELIRPAGLFLSWCLCVCVHNPDLQHLLVDAIMAVRAEVGLVFVFSELGHSTKVTGFAGFCIQNQTLSQQPKNTPGRFSFSYQNIKQVECTQPSCRA